MSGPDILGYLAALTVLVTFWCRSMVALRCYAILSNVLFIAYAALMGFFPILVLHLVLLPVNAVYLGSELRKLAESQC
jgi:hypothetical protein